MAVALLAGIELTLACAADESAGNATGGAGGAAGALTGGSATSGQSAGPSGGGGNAPTGGTSPDRPNAQTGGASVTGGGPATGGTSPSSGGHHSSGLGGSPDTGGATGGSTTGGSTTGGSTTGGSATGGGAGTSAGSGGATSALPPLTIFLAGDSTVSTYKDTASTSDQAGWGQMFGALFDSKVKVENRALGGRTARRFIDEGHLDEIIGDLEAGDYLLVQFGTNDSNKTATYELGGEQIPYYLEPSTDFKTYLRKYVDGAAERGATAMFVTPPPRNSAYCTGGNGTGSWAAAMRELGADIGTPVLDLNQKAVDHLKAICPAPTPENFFLLRADGSVDGTHFQENGARELARFVAGELRRISLPLAAYLK